MSKFKPGDKVVFEHPHRDPEYLTLKQVDKSWAESYGTIWETEENDVYLYQEKYLRLRTPLEELL